jgi:hypothetical protein
MEDRFRSLFSIEQMKKIEDEEAKLATSPKDAPLQGAGAMFLIPLLKDIWRANLSASPSKSVDENADELNTLWTPILTAAATCSVPAVLESGCKSAIELAKKSIADHSKYIIYLMESMNGMPQLKKWISYNLLDS